ncbi:MAG: NAD(P)/FAD-dependent oxidoreductase [Actinomycetota bacterium]
MAEVLVVGAGVGGLGSALALARTGHRVTVVERDPVEMVASPDEAFEHWRRRGAPQTRHSHAFLARCRNLLRDRAPEVLAALLDAGASEIDFTRHPPPDLHPLAPEPGDEDLVGLACRRTTFEWVLRRLAEATPGVAVVPGAVECLLAEDRPSGVPHVVGVGLAGGEARRADLVVDAGGRRSPLPGWLAALGCQPVPEAQEDTGIIYSSRFYRVGPDDDDPAAQPLLVGDLGYLKFAVFPGDNRTLSITFGVHADDAEMRRLLQPGPFTALAAAIPASRRWVESARCQPISGVEVMGDLVNRRRRFVVGGRPLATGVFAVGDSAVCTNPLYGRGCSLALVHAELLADTLAAHGAGDGDAEVAFAEATRAEVEPWYGAALAQDRHDRLADDEEEAGGPVGVGSLMRHGLLPAARTDPVVYRAFMRAFNLLDLPDAMMRDAHVVMRIMATWQGRDTAVAPPPPGPERGELLQRLAGAA